MRRLRPLGSLEWLLRYALSPTRTVRVRAASGVVLYDHARDMLGRHVAKYGEYEPQLTAWIGRHLGSQRRRGIVVDVGAQIGWHSLHAARVATVKTVVACEPDLTNLSLLERNLAANEIENVLIAPWAIGGGAGQGRLSRYKSSNIGRHSLIADYGGKRRSVPILPLDATLELFGLGRDPIHLLKVDVEGYELEVIRGAGRALARTAAIVLEFSPLLMREGKYAPEALVAKLIKSGFAPFIFDRAGALTALDRARLKLPKPRDLIWLRRR